IRQIIHLPQRVVLVFGEAVEGAPKADIPAVDVEVQRKRISAAVGSSIDISYFGDRSSGEIGCAVGGGFFDLYLCDRNSVSVVDFKQGEPKGKERRLLTAHSESVSAIALSPS